MQKNRLWAILYAILIAFCLNGVANAKIVPVSRYTVTANENSDYYVISSENIREIQAIRAERDYLLQNTGEGSRRIFVGAGLGTNGGQVIGGYLF